MLKELTSVMALRTIKSHLDQPKPSKINNVYPISKKINKGKKDKPKLTKINKKPPKIHQNLSKSIQI